jgi:hypothetical protein
MVASTTRHTTSTPVTASVAVSFSRVPRVVFGLWIPGVSTNTTCASGRFSTPRTWLRVVWGLSETMLTLTPRMRLSSVDFPTFGRPTNVTSPAWTSGVGAAPADARIASCSRSMRASKSSLTASPHALRRRHRPPW